ncbi:ZP domain-containing protein-like [Pristis pectinata]|uniref:ZP domain-containing protein-like n=1 Tax=Pristis pectinata TaxID=685728 RepID=UPI00223D3241|nr:ZP domain-containing protein-like [Pristis pectinata]
MILSASRNLVANLPDDSLQLNDASCNVTGNSTHLLLTIPFSGCGTELLEDKSHYIFTNKIVSQSRSETSKQLERVAIPLMCKFLRSSKGSERANVLNDAIDKIFEVYSFEIQFSKEFNSSWRAARPDSPFIATSKDHLYISIIAKSNETALSLYVESCHVSKEYNSSTGVMLLRQGCLNNSTAKEHQTKNQNEKIYSIKLSSLPWRTAQVFITCSVQLCADTSGSSPCTLGCGSGSGSQADQSNIQQVSAGPVHITKESDFGPNYAAITVGLALGGTVVYVVLILLKRSFVGLYYRGNTRSTRSRRF